MAPASNFALTAKQSESLRDSTGKVNIWVGAIRSGKTIVSILRWFLYLATAPEGQLIMAGRTLDSVWRNVLAPMQDPRLFGAAAKQVVGTFGTDTVHIFGRRITVIGAPDNMAAQKIQGVTCAGAYVDEVTTLPETFFKMLLGRMSVPGSKIFGTTNPDGPAHWLKRDYLDHLDEFVDWRVFSFRIDDNTALDPSFVEAKKREYRGLYYARFIEGRWVAAEGAVWPHWDESAHVVPWASLPPMDRLLGIGFDYGTQNASVGILLGLCRSGLFLIDEWRYDSRVNGGRRLTDVEQSKLFRQWLFEVKHTPQDAPDPAIEWLVIDPAAASMIEQLRVDGVKNITSANNDVLPGIQLISSLLGTSQLFVSDRCRGFITEAPGYSWDSKAAEKGEDKPVKVADHSLDAARYVIATTENIWRRRLRRSAA